MFRGYFWKQRRLIKIRYSVLVHTETTETRELTNHDEIVVSADDCKYGVWGKQIHNHLANKCKISNKTVTKLKIFARKLWLLGMFIINYQHRMIKASKFVLWRKMRSRGLHVGTGISPVNFYRGKLKQPWDFWMVSISASFFFIKSSRNKTLLGAFSRRK